MCDFLYIVHIAKGLICYDNIFNDGEAVLIGCDFPGAACATTREKTTTTWRFGLKAYNTTSDS